MIKQVLFFFLEKGSGGECSLLILECKLSDASSRITNVSPSKTDKLTEPSLSCIID